MCFTKINDRKLHLTMFHQSREKTERLFHTCMIILFDYIIFKYLFLHRTLLFRSAYV